MTRPEPQRFETEFGGRSLVIETGVLAGQANGAVLVRYGDTTVLATATMASPRPGIDFFPLLVDYEERGYAVGRIPGSVGRREGRPSENATLNSRLIDRTLRPLFPDGFRNDVQVVATVMSVDPDNPPEVAALIGASAALSISDIPFDGPVAGIRVGLIGDEFVVNPTLAQQAASRMDLAVGGHKKAVNMVEAGAQEVPEETMLEAIMFAHASIQPIIALIERMQAEIGKPKLEVALYEPAAETAAFVTECVGASLSEAIKNADKQARSQAVDACRERVFASLEERFGPDEAALRRKDAGVVFDDLMKQAVRRMITIEGLRPDGRSHEEIRPIWCDVGILPRAHGSGIFTRGQTQALTICTLGVKADEQVIGISDLGESAGKRYIHHYNFPAYSVGETRPMRSPGRREIGHGALAERALLPVIPSPDQFPYTLRLVSEILSSNGSTSQASVCGSTLALMDAGVPIKAPVAGIAMGLVEYEDKQVVLTDIQGIEDHLGDMDFKVAGTEAGVTALQMDIKITGVGREILEKALAQAKAARLFVLEKMLAAISGPRSGLSRWAPRIIGIEIPVDKIRDVIGPGGKMIRKIIEVSGATIDVEDDGRVFIASVSADGGEKAKQMIENLVRDVEVGAVYTGTVKRIMNFGAFVEILPGKEGLVHISKLAPGRVGKVEDVLQIGDTTAVKVTEIDNLGRINLSRKDALSPEQFKEEQARFGSAGGETNGDGDGNGHARPPQGAGRRPPRRERD